jgi:hypothetical protein
MNPYQSSNDTMLLTGWLFADLLLGLMMIFLVSLTGVPSLPKGEGTGAATHTPTATATHTPTATATDTPTVAPTSDTSAPVVTAPPLTPTPAIGLSTVPITLTLQIEEQQIDNFLQGGEEQVALIRQQLENQVQDGAGTDKFGFVLIFGHSGSPAEGNLLASKTGQLLQESLPELFEYTVFENLHQIDAKARGKIIIKGYLLMGGE